MCSKCQSDDAAAPANVWMLTIAESEVLRLRRIESAARKVVDSASRDEQNADFYGDVDGAKRAAGMVDAAKILLAALES